MSLSQTITRSRRESTISPKLTPRPAFRNRLSYITARQERQLRLLFQPTRMQRYLIPGTSGHMPSTLEANQVQQSPSGEWVRLKLLPSPAPLTLRSFLPPEAVQQMEMGNRAAAGSAK